MKSLIRNNDFIYFAKRIVNEVQKIKRDSFLIICRIQLDNQNKYMRKQRDEESRFQNSRRVCLKAQEQLGEVSIIVYGSRAREDSEPFSDMDICVIVEKMDRKTREIIFTTAWEAGFKEGVVIVPLIFEKKEWKDSPILESPIYKNIQREGVEV